MILTPAMVFMENHLGVGFFVSVCDVAKHAVGRGCTYSRRALGGPREVPLFSVQYTFNHPCRLTCSDSASSIAVPARDTRAVVALVRPHAMAPETTSSIDPHN